MRDRLLPPLRGYHFLFLRYPWAYAPRLYATVASRLPNSATSKLTLRVTIPTWRKPKDSKEKGNGSREAAAAACPASICCRRFAAWESLARIPWAYAQGFMLSPLSGWKSATSKLTLRVTILLGHWHSQWDPMIESWQTSSIYFCILNCAARTLRRAYCSKSLVVFRLGARQFLAQHR